MMLEREKFEEDLSFDPIRKPIPRFEQLCPADQAALIAENPDYGEIVCRCEKVTRAEILQAIHNPLGCATMASVKYRTRSMMGRCQGGYCQMRISQMLEEETGQSETELVYMRKDGHPFFGKVREEEGWDPAAGAEAGSASGAGSASATGSRSGAGNSDTGKEVAK
jgi:glycerol-3-phosphate dehydrogenase